MGTLKNRLHVLTIIAILILAWSIHSSRGLAAPGAAVQAAPVGTPFVYEGKLSTFTGSYDLQFRLYNAATNGTIVGSGDPNTRLAVALTTGAYAVQLNFGPTAFDGSARWIEVRYKAAGQNVDYSVQAPRQSILAVPYALSLRPGATVSGNVPAPGAVIRGTNTATGSGVVGKSTSGNGVYGETAATTAAWAGVYGKSSGAGGMGVIGEATGSGHSWGVYGVGTHAGVVGRASTGIGVSGISTSGYAMESYGHATQRLDSGGWVKAMAFIDPRLTADAYVQGLAPRPGLCRAEMRGGLRRTCHDARSAVVPALGVGAITLLLQRSNFGARPCSPSSGSGVNDGSSKWPDGSPGPPTKGSSTSDARARWIRPGAPACGQGGVSSAHQDCGRAHST